MSFTTKPNVIVQETEERVNFELNRSYTRLRVYFLHLRTIHSLLNRVLLHTYAFGFLGVIKN